MKVGNIGRLDPDLKEKGITGLGHGSKIEIDVWNEFYGNPDLLAFESERIIAKLTNQSIENSASIRTDDLPSGTEREVIVKQRINQSFFRNAVLSAYNFRCCISGVLLADLLEACHIVDWSEDVHNRTNPKNGLCMNPFFHQAYDKLLLGISPDLQVIVSEDLLLASTDDSFTNYLKHINGRTIILPDKFFPKKEFLEIHYNKFINR